MGKSRAIYSTRDSGVWGKIFVQIDFRKLKSSCRRIVKENIFWNKKGRFFFSYCLIFSLIWPESPGLSRLPGKGLGHSSFCVVAKPCGTLQGNEHFPTRMVLQGLLEQMIPLSWTTLSLENSSSASAGMIIQLLRVLTNSVGSGFVLRRFLSQLIFACSPSFLVSWNIETLL